MATAIINPGIGPANDYGRCCLDWARSNMRAFVRDVGGLEVAIADLGDDGDGRYAFRLSRDKRKTLVSMPGVGLARVRYVDAAGQNIWHFPRLYVDGHSYVWLYAVEAAREALEPPIPV